MSIQRARPPSSTSRRHPALSPPATPPRTAVELSPISPHGCATYDVHELATLLGIGRDAVYAAAERNEIPGTLRIGRRLVFARAKVLAWLGDPAVLPSGRQPASSD